MSLYVGSVAGWENRPRKGWTSQFFSYATRRTSTSLPSNLNDGVREGDIPSKLKKNQMSALEKLICKDSCADKNEDVDGSQMGWVSSLYARQGEKKRAKRGLARRRRVKGRIEQQSDEGGCNLGQHCEGHG